VQKGTQKPPPNASLTTDRAKPQRLVSIGILTYKRPDGLQRCLQSVQVRLRQSLPDPWSLNEILVIDNDPEGSARAVVPADPATTGDDTSRPCPIRYVPEPAPGIAAARNRALAEADGDVLVFIDDDEVAEQGWPHELLKLMDDSGAAMVGGPVRSHFDVSPPAWILEGGFFDRDDPPHGSRQSWLRSGNLAIDLHQIRAAGIRFDRRFPQGEDSAFSRLAQARGLDLRWSARGAITEFVRSDRFEVGWRLRREYSGHRAWTRSSLDLAGGRLARLATRLRTIAVAAARIGTGLGHLARSLPTRNKAKAVRGLIDLVGGAGNLVETAVYHPPRQQ